MARFPSLLILAACSLSVLAQGTINFNPTVRIIEPVGNVVLYSLSNSVTLRVEASDPDGSISEVRLLQNGALMATDFQPPYEFIFKPINFIIHTLEVQAVDNLGGTGSSTRTVEVIRVYDNYGPEVPVIRGTNLTRRATNIDATRQKGEPNHANAAGGRSVWWAWIPTVTGTVTIDTFGSDFDTVLGVYTNVLPTPSALTNLITVAANGDDSANPPLSRVKFFAIAMQRYYIAVDGQDGFAGNIVLNIQQTPSRAPANDFLASAVRVFGNTIQTATNIGATKEPGEPNHAGNAGGASLWWRFEGAQSRVSISTAGSTFDTLLAVYTAATNGVIVNREGIPLMESLRPLIFNDDAGTSTSRTSIVEFTPRFATTYWVAVDGYNGAEGNIRLTFSSQPQEGARPTNDLFTSATIIQGGSAIANANTFLATSEFGEPQPIAPKLGAKSVWYRWVAPASGLVYLTTKGSDFDTLLGVFVGTNITNLAVIASNDDDGGLATSALTFTAAAGTEYRIAVAGFQGAGGDLILTLNQPSSLAPRLITSFTQGTLSLSAPNLAGAFVLEVSSDLANWSYLREMTTEEVVLGAAPGGGQRQQFYRLRDLQ